MNRVVGAKVHSSVSPTSIIRCLPSTWRLYQFLIAAIFLVNLFEIFINSRGGVLLEGWLEYSGLIYPTFSHFVPAFQQLEKIITLRGYPERSDIFLNDLLVNFAIYALLMPIGLAFVCLDFSRKG